MKVDIQILTEKDINELTELISVFADVFEMEDFVCPDNNHLLKLLRKENFIAVTARLKNKVIGGMTVYILEQYYSAKPLAYIFDLAVLREFQRKGIGKQLVEYIKNYCREKGFEEVFVQADKIDDYALDFYRSTKPTAEEEVVHFYYSLNNGKQGSKSYF